jgi:hypothetical protein
MWREFEMKAEALLETPRPPINEEVEIDFKAHAFPARRKRRNCRASAAFTFKKSDNATMPAGGSR